MKNSQLLLETLCMIDGSFEDITPHLRRMSRSRHTLWPNIPEIRENDLLKALGDIRIQSTGTWKVRILYNQSIRHVEAIPYTPKPIHTVAIVDGESLDYSLKWANRTKLEELTTIALQLGADAPLIVKSGYITDFTHANVVAFDGTTWWTPSHPLLPGTQRERLIHNGSIKTTNIKPSEIIQFQLISPINAMLKLGDITIKPNNFIYPL